MNERTGRDDAGDSARSPDYNMFSGLAEAKHAFVAKLGDILLKLGVPAVAVVACVAGLCYIASAMIATGTTAGIVAALIVAGMMCGLIALAVFRAPRTNAQNPQEPSGSSPDARPE